MSTTLKPVNGHVILKPVEEQEQMSGNIIIPDLGKEKPEIAVIVAVSDTINWHTGDTVKIEGIEVGKKVVIPKLGSQRISIGSEEYFMTKATEIISIIED